MSSDNRFDFIGKRKMAAFISIALIAISIIVVSIQGGLNYNIEFNGGYQVQVGFKDPVSINNLREQLKKSQLNGVQLQSFSDESLSGDFKSEIMIKIETMDQDIASLEKTVSNILDINYNGRYDIMQRSSIGPQIGDELKSAAIKAIIYAMLGILIYITLKFQFHYGLAAVVTLVHDVIITVGIYSLFSLLFDYEISLSVIAALMTIVGYSLNDTIVVFDRIRENIEKYDDCSFKDVVNISLNNVLSRTLLTSLTTLFVVIVLFLVGGEVIRGLSLTLLLGVIIGTYSSVFVASPFVIWWNGKKSTKLSKI